MPKPSLTPSAKTPWAGIRLRELVEAGVIEAPATLVARYRGREYRATLKADGLVEYEGRTFQSPSTAGAHVRLAVMGPREGRPYPQTNGWTFWSYERATGTLVPLDSLRRQYFAMGRTEERVPPALV